MPKQIVIAEDSHPQRECLVNILTKEGFGVLEAQNGLEALQHISTNTPDLLVTDIGMPVMDGYELIERLTEKGYTFPIIVQSGGFDASRISYLGKMEYFKKPLMEKDENRFIARANALCGANQ